MKNFLMALISLVLSAQLTPHDANGQDEDWRWPNTTIHVCWSNPKSSTESGYDEDLRKRDLVKKYVNAEWGRFSAVEFIGWSTCGENSENGIQIRIMREGDLSSSGKPNPNSAEGFDWMMDLQKHDENPRPGMELRFDESDAYIISSSLHEFGHALGFSHEHRRTNAEGELEIDFACKAIHEVEPFPDNDGNYLSSTYDANSIMSYCPLFGHSFNAISEGDALGVQRVYGEGISGSLFKPAYGSGKAACDQKYPAMNGQEAAFLHVFNQSCWSCPTGYKRTVNPDVESNGACEKPGQTLVTTATYRGPATGVFSTDCPSGQFLHGLSGKCYSCPSGYGRTLAGIDADNACSRTETATYSAGSYRGAPGCDDGGFENGVTGQCYTCPGAYERTTIPSPALEIEPKACVRKDWGVARMVTLPWRILSLSN